MPLQALLFDMDGTLGDTIPVVIRALRETFEHFSGRTYTDAEITAMFGPAEEGVIAARVADADYPAALRMYLDRYEALHAAAVEPFPGIADLLADLRARGIHTGVVTGKGPGTAAISMRVMGLDRWIERVEAGSPNGAVKPAAIRKLLGEWGVDPAQAAYVGDMPYDMQAARDAGVLPIAAAWAESATVEAEAGVLLFRAVAELRRWVGEAGAGKPQT